MIILARGVWNDDEKRPWYHAPGDVVYGALNFANGNWSVWATAPTQAVGTTPEVEWVRGKTIVSANPVADTRFGEVFGVSADGMTLVAATTVSEDRLANLTGFAIPNASLRTVNTLNGFHIYQRTSQAAYEWTLVSSRNATGITGDITSIAVSADGSHIVVTSSAATVVLSRQSPSSANVWAVVDTLGFGSSSPTGVSFGGGNQFFITPSSIAPSTIRAYNVNGTVNWLSSITTAANVRSITADKFATIAPRTFCAVLSTNVAVVYSIADEVTAFALNSVGSSITGVGSAALSYPFLATSSSVVDSAVAKVYSYGADWAVVDTITETTLASNHSFGYVSCDGTSTGSTHHPPPVSVSCGLSLCLSCLYLSVHSRLLFPVTAKC